MTDDEKQHYVEMGKYFGYPDCCIQWFITERVEKFPNCPPLTTQQEAIHGNNGFIPCPACAEKVTPETIGTLIHNRQCSEPYGNISKTEGMILKLFGA